MRITLVTLAAVFCLQAGATTPSSDDKMSDEAIVQAAEKLIASDPKAAGVTATTAPADGSPTAAASLKPAATDEIKPPAATANEASKKESEIPVFLDAKKADDKGLGSVAWRLLASLGLIGVVGGALIYASRRWARQKDKGGNKARIEMLHQFHMGPRKSLALVRVSGEAILIGVTDHSINMIKPVALIDDELAGVLGKDFNNFLEDEFSMEDVRTALGPRV